MLATINLTKSYNDTAILKGVNMNVVKGQIVSIVGASGAGKGTLLHIVDTLDKPDEGKVLIDDVDVFSLSPKKMAHFRNTKIGFVFQFHHLLPEFTAIENVAMPAWINNISKKDAEKNAQKLLEMLNLKDRLFHKPNELSGGEQQRVAIARALINQPAIILADEPTGNLDSKNSLEIFNILNDLKNELKQTIIMVTHNLDLANRCDLIFKIEDGKTL